MSQFHYLTIPGPGGGVERVDGQAVGLDLEALLQTGPPPLKTALELITALAELVAILEEDACPHGAIDLGAVFVDDIGAMSIEGFGHDDASRAADRFGLGRVALALLGGGWFVPPAGARAHEEQALEAILLTDLSDLDGGIVGDVQWFLARLLDYDASIRPDPVEVWRSFVAFADVTPGPELAAWSAAAIEGGGERRQGLASAELADGPLDAGLAFGPATRHGTAFLSKDALKTASQAPPAGGGSKTTYWSDRDLEAMAEGSATAPRPKRGTGRGQQRQETVIRTPSPTLIASSGPLPEEVQIRRKAQDHDPHAATVFQNTEQLESDDRRRFSVQQCLGRGGFGEVYLCTMESAGGMRSQVAVKVLREGIDPRAQAVSRLRDEARILGTLQHPAILTAHDLVVLADRVAMVTEYVPGADLDVCIASDDPPSLRALLEVLTVTSEALDASWNARDASGTALHLVHRDIKPSNIRIGTHGQVKVLDFGIAKFSSAREAKTQANQLIGTLSYMSPERLQGTNDHPAGDVYALGAILFEALAGQGLWDRLTSRQQFDLSFEAARYDAFVMPLVEQLQAAETLRELVRATLHHDPDARPTAGVLARMLEDTAEETPGRSLRRWARDHAFPPPEALEGELVGRTLTEGRSSSGVQLPTGARPRSARPAAPPSSPPPERRPVRREPDLPKPAPTPQQAAPPPSRPAPPEPEPVPHPQRQRPEAPPTSFAHVDAPTPSPPAERHPPPPPAPAPPPQPSQRSARSLPPGYDPTDPHVFDRPSPLRWAIPVLLLALLLGGGATALAVGGGLYALSGGEAQESASEAALAELAAVPEPGGADPDEAIDEAPDPAPTQPNQRSKGTTRPHTPSPSPGPVPQADPHDAVADAAGTAVVEAVAAATQAEARVDACGDPLALEPRATAARLTQAERSCLQAQMMNPALKMTDRQKLGRLALVDAANGCTRGQPCSSYESLQDAYFADLGRSDPDMMLTYATHLAGSAGTSVPRLEKAMLWADRALERSSAWKGRSHSRNVLAAMRLRGRSAARLYELDASDARREVARDHVIAWANKARQLSLPATEPETLCRSITGSAEVCEKRISTDAVTEDIKILSIPPTAIVTIDGKEAGRTPMTAKLTHGSHEVKVALEGVEATQAIKVGGGQPNRWIWDRAANAWSSSL